MTTCLVAQVRENLTNRVIPRVPGGDEEREKGESNDDDEEEEA